MKNKLALVSFLIITSFALSACANKKQINSLPATDENITESAEQETQTATQATELNAQQKSIELTAKTDGQTAYQLLTESHQAEVKNYDFGIFIEAIDGIMGNNENYWAFYLNGEYAQKGADQTILKQGDKIEFRYEQIQN